MSQFFYKRKEKKDPKVEGSADRVVYDCINTDKVIRGVWFGKVFMLLLDDGHENSEIIGPAKYNKNGTMTQEPPRGKVWRQSEIELDEEDAARFRELTDYTYDVESDLDEKYMIHSEGGVDPEPELLAKQEEKAIL